MPKLKVALYFLISISIAIPAMFFIDQALAGYFLSPENAHLKYFGTLITDIGLAENYFLIALFVFIYTSWTLRRSVTSELVKERATFFKHWSLNFLLALVTSGVLVHLFKNIIGRARPHHAPDFYPFVFESFNFNWRWQSMPSGHSQVMFTAATLFAIAFPRFKYFWFGFASLICFSRVMVGDHFFSDIILGGFTGWLGATIALFWLSKTKVSLLNQKNNS